MNSATYVFGKVIKKYNITVDLIDDLNLQYENHKKSLSSAGDRLAGRLNTELEFIDKISQCKIAPTIVDCMNDYIKTIKEINLFKGKDELEIISLWVNDMQEGEYNPPHTHHDNTGWSTVLFLKVPEIINDEKHKHKFLDGKLGFINDRQEGTTWMKPEVGVFYIFKAEHAHCVMPFKPKNAGDIRRSMSFNFIEKIV